MTDTLFRRTCSFYPLFNSGNTVVDLIAPTSLGPAKGHECSEFRPASDYNHAQRGANLLYYLFILLLSKFSAGVFISNVRTDHDQNSWKLFYLQFPSVHSLDAKKKSLIFSPYFHSPQNFHPHPQILLHSQSYALEASFPEKWGCFMRYSSKDNKGSQNCGFEDP